MSSPPSLFNFEATPQVVGGPYQYGIPGARHAVVFAPEEIGGELTETERRTIVVIANETVASAALIDEIRHRAAEGLWRFTIAVANEGGDRAPPSGACRSRCRCSPRPASTPAAPSWTATRSRPYAAVSADEDVHEVMLATYPTGRSGLDGRRHGRPPAQGHRPRHHARRRAARGGRASPSPPRRHPRSRWSPTTPSATAGLVEALRERADRQPIGVVLLYPMALDRPRLDRRGRGARAPPPPTACRAAIDGLQAVGVQARGEVLDGDAAAAARVAVADHAADVILVVATRGGRLESDEALAAVRAAAGIGARRADRRRCGGPGLPVRELADGHHRAPRSRAGLAGDAARPRGAARSAWACSSMIFFIGSEVMLFGSFFAAYFFVRFNVADQWPPLNAEGEPFELPMILTGVNTAILVASSFTLHWGEHRLKHYDDRKGLERGLLRDDVPGRDLPDDPDQRVHPPRASPPRTRPSARPSTR